MAGEDADLAWLIGLMHDIGRFEQARRYGTFVDSLSVDHAELSADLLFGEGLAERFPQDGLPEDWRSIAETAIRQHNKLKPAETTDDRMRRFTELIRDADKTDIFRVIATIPFEDRVGSSRANFTETEEASPDVMACVLEHRVDIWDYYLRNVDSYLTQIVMSFRHYDPGCPDSSSGYHSWEHRTEPYHGYFCSECGAEFRYYNVAPGSMSDAYDAFVADLPFTGISSDGSYVLYATHSGSYLGSPNATYYSPCDHFSGSFGSNYTLISGASFSCDSFSTSVSYSGSGVVRPFFSADWSFDFPCAGSFTAYIDPVFTYESNYSYFKLYSGWNASDHVQSSEIREYRNSIMGNDYGSPGRYTSFSLTINAPYAVFTPDSPLDSSSMPEASRPTDLSFNFAVEDNDTYIVFNDITIINEGDSIYYNPVTNTTYDLSSWTFDYSTRTYNVTTMDDDTFSITFGDLSLTLDEGGGDVYELFYTVEQAPPALCNHVFSVSDHQDPSCTLNGYTEYTCSQCGSSYRDTLFALGHEWSFVESFEAEYDENDELVADAYDLYRCIRCGLEKHEAPGSHDDSHDYSGFFSWLQKWLNDFKTWLGDKLDALLGKETEINVDVDNRTVTVINEDGEEEEVDVPDIISRFGWFKDAWAIGTYFVETVGANEQAAYIYAEVTRSGAKGGEVATGAPSIKLNLGAAQSQYGYDYGGEVEALDLSWYTPYKQTVDNLVSGFLWIVFLWNVFRHAPGIISGSGLTSNHLDDLEQGHKERKRSK